MSQPPPHPEDRDERPLYLDPNLQIVFAVTLMAVLGVSSITPAFPEIARVFHLSSQTVGMLITAFTLPGVLLAPFLGVLADRWGRKRILVPSLFLFGLAGGACALVRHFTLLLILRFVQGIGAAALSALYATIIGDLFQGRKRATAMGYNAAVLSVGTASYPTIGGALATLAWYYPFALPVVAIPIGLLVLLGLRNPEPEPELNLRGYLRRIWGNVKDRRVAGVFTASLMTFIILYGAFLTYLPFFLEETFQASSLIIGLALSGMSVVTALTSSQLGKLVKVIAKPRLVQIAFGFYAASLVLMPSVPVIWILAFPLILFGLGHGMNIPTVQTLLADLTPMEHRGAFMSVNGMVLRLGQTVGPLIMGALLALGGISVVFYSGAAFALLTVLLVGILLE